MEMAQIISQERAHEQQHICGQIVDALLPQNNLSIQSVPQERNQDRKGKVCGELSATDFIRARDSALCSRNASTALGGDRHRGAVCRRSHGTGLGACDAGSWAQHRAAQELTRQRSAIAHSWRPVVPPGPTAEILRRDSRTD